MLAIYSLTLDREPLPVVFSDLVASAAAIAAIVSAGAAVQQARYTRSVVQSADPNSGNDQLRPNLNALLLTQWISAAATFTLGIILIGSGLFGFIFFPGRDDISIRAQPVRIFLLSSGLLSLFPLLSLVLSGPNQTANRRLSKLIYKVNSIAISTMLSIGICGALLYSIQHRFVLGNVEMTMPHRWSLLLFVAISLAILLLYVRTRHTAPHLSRSLPWDNLVITSMILLYSISIAGYPVIMPHQNPTDGGLAQDISVIDSSSINTGDHVLVLAKTPIYYNDFSDDHTKAIVELSSVVVVTGSLSNGFYPIEWDGFTGFIVSDSIVKTTATPTKRGIILGHELGIDVATYATGLLGRPYVWATHGPASFDASGFTYWVAKNTLGIDIGIGASSQLSSGLEIQRSGLRAGDLVFFADPSTSIPSYIGIYLGNGLFIHAANESTGVTISDINSPIFTDSWLTARRLT